MINQMIFDLYNFIFIAVGLLTAVTIHEYAHARTALHFGDATAKMYGRLTLNPLKHIDPIGALMLILFKFGWAKPVPINPRNFDNYKKGTLWVSLAGPLSNLSLAVAIAILARILSFLPLPFAVMTIVDRMFDILIIYNIFFAVFNMIPVPPLDGSKVLGMLLPPKQSYYYSQYMGQIEQYGFWVLILLVATGALGTIMMPFTSFFMFLISLIKGAPIF